LGTADESVSGLVLEVAQSLAGVGRSVLLVDGQIGGMSDFRDQVAGGATLSDLVADHADDPTLHRHVSEVLDACVAVAPNLRVLPGDPRNVDAVDILASKSFRALTEQALSRHEIVIVVGPSALSPFAYVMTGLVSAYVVVSTVGRTRQAHVDQLVKQFSGSRSRLIGSVLLGIRPRRGWVQASTVSQGRGAALPLGPDAEPGEESEQGLLDRLGQSLGALAGDKTEK
jgi:Mrp family chromosome partitioning ATPase